MRELYNDALVFDIEADGLLDTITKIHCIAVGGLGVQPTLYTGEAIRDGLLRVQEAPCIVGHNIQSYDIPAIQKVVPSWAPKGLVRDTLIMSRLQRVHQMQRHSLKAWGELLKFPKDDYTGGWENYNEEMGIYCKQDVRVNCAVWENLLREDYPERAIQLEHDFANILDWQMHMGIHFNEEDACRLAQELEIELEETHKEIIKTVPQWEEVFMPKVNNKRFGYTKGVPFIKRTPFNPGSRTQVVKFFKNKYKWEPVEFTPKKNPKVSGAVLKGLTYPEAPLFAKYFNAKKLIGQVLTGENAWLKVCKDDGRIYSYINHNGAVTGRCTHSKPNLAQVPRVTSYQGERCRALFGVDTNVKDKWKLVGCDASGLELRNLAHYMAAYDDGKYAREVLTGDIHTANQKAAGLPTRDHAKTFIYAHNYGAGDAKLGDVLDPDASYNQKKSSGAVLRQTFMSRVPALKLLLNGVQAKAKRQGYLLGLDGRKLWIRESYRALNTLLQGAGSVIMKEATVLQWKEVIGDKLDWRTYMSGSYMAFPLLHVHDETQSCVASTFVEEFKTVTERAIYQAGVNFNYKCDLAGEAKEGLTWAQTH